MRQTSGIDLIFERSGRILAGDFDPDTRAWLSTAWRRYLEGMPLEHALGLHEVFPRGGRNCLLLHNRNGHLRAAARLVDGMSATERARNLQPFILKFEGAIWQAWRTRAEPPEHASVINLSLWCAKKTGLPLPTSIKQLSRIIDQADK